MLTLRAPAAGAFDSPGGAAFPSGQEAKVVHVVIAGDEDVAVRITESLMSKHDVVYVTSNATSAARFDRLDIQVIDGAPTAPATLREARVDRADFFIACSSSDEQNLVGCLVAQRLGATQTVCFLNAHGLDLVEGDDMAVAESIGIDFVLRPAEQLAEEIIQIVTVPGALDVRSFHGGKLRLLKAVVGEGAPIAGAPLGEQKIPRGVRLVTVQRSDEYFVPNEETVLEPGDRLTAMGIRWRLRRFMAAKVRGRSGGHETKRAIIVGGGTVGVYVAKGLRDSGWEVKVIEADLRRCEQISERLDCLVLHGDGSDLDLLEQERVDTMAALVAVTNNDEKNLLVSLIAKHMGVPRIITRADRATNERIFDKVGIDVVLSARGAAIRSVVQDVVEGDGEHIAELEHGDFGVLDLHVPNDFEPTTVRELRPPTVAAVGAIVRGRKLIVPRPTDEIRPGDRLLVVCRSTDEDRTCKFLLEKEERESRRTPSTDEKEA